MSTTAEQEILRSKMSRRSFALAACASAALTACACGVSGVSIRTTNVHVQDMAGIEKLHRQETAATLSGDLAALAELWTDDIVRLQQDQEAEIGKHALVAADERRSAVHAAPRVLSYVPEIKDVTVTDDGGRLSGVTSRLATWTRPAAMRNVSGGSCFAS